MSSIGEFDPIGMGDRVGESVTDLPDWDNEEIEFDSRTGIYYVAGKPVVICQSIAMFQEKSDNEV